MEHTHLTLQGQAVARTDCVDERSIVSRLDTASDELPACLLVHAPPTSWAAFSLPDSSQQVAFPSKNIFLSDSLLKAQNPDLMFEQIRRLLADDQYFAFKIVTAENIKHRIQTTYHSLVFPVYYPFHFLFRRVLPKLKGFRKMCRLLQVPVDVSKAEIMGRLIYKGFELIDIQESNRETILITRRNSDGNPSLLKAAPSEGFLFRMQRMGQYSTPINVYKLRSMHPYAEYVQAYVHDTQGLDKGGKFKNDFRVSTGGRVIRKYWLDEIPMLYNVLKGDLKLIGVRPISEHYFKLYPPHVQELRTKHKPGLLPPFYADLPETFEEIVQSELNYLKAYEANPFQTDLRYFKRIVTNIIVNKARSK